MTQSVILIYTLIFFFPAGIIEIITEIKIVILNYFKITFEEEESG